MSPELGMHSAMFQVLIWPPLAFVLTLVGGIIAGFVLDRFYGDSRSFKSNDIFGVMSLVCVVAVGLSLGALVNAPPLGMMFPVSTYVTLFVTCALVSFWSGVHKNRKRPLSLRTDKRSFNLGKPIRGKVWFDTGVLRPASPAPVKLKLEIRPDEDMTVVVVYSAKDGSFKNREIFSEDVKKNVRYAWEIEIPHVSGTATVYLVTGEGGSWAGSKDYEF